MKISKIILATQSVLLAYFSLFGFMLAFSPSVVLLMEPFEIADLVSFLFGIILFSFLISGWRVYFWVLLNGPKKGKKISKVWLALCCLSLFFILSSSLLYVYSEGEGVDNIILRNSTLFVFGVYFIPTAIHVALEWYWQSKSTAKS